MADPKHPHGFNALDDLAARVAEVKKEREESVQKVAIDRSGMSAGLRMASEFVSAILVGGLLGYGVDFLAKTTPWCLLVGLALGFVTGTVNLIRVSRIYSAAHPVDPSATPVKDDDQDEDA
jgi:ATP synthase protein I